MSDELRQSVSKVVIYASAGGSGETVKGTYGRETDGFVGGMAEGSGIGTIPVEVGGIPVGIPIPILREIGMLAGAFKGGYEEQLQEFRDKMTDDLRDATDQPLSNDSLANDVFWGLRKVPGVEPKILDPELEAPQGTDAILYVALTDFSINVQEEEAVIETVATARLVNASDGAALYRAQVSYQDRDTLSNWTDDDTALWREYRNFARHYIGREIAAVLYERVPLDGELAPTGSANIKVDKNNDWLAETRSLQPTLAWDFALSEAGAAAVNAADIAWDLEIYDANRPVYSATQVRGNSHVLNVPLETCKTYRWSVRPSYPVNNVRKYGAWMRNTPVGNEGNGNIGRAASDAHAYIQDFAALEVHCKAR